MHELNDPSRHSPEDPPRLAAALMRLHAVSANVPAERDEAMRRAIRTHFDQMARESGETSRRRRILPWLAGAGGLSGLAAAIALAIWLGRFASPPRTVTPPATIARAQPADIDGSGRIDILDAFALARMLESNQASAAVARDLTGDGAIDQRDVDAIALQAVALTPRAAPGTGGQSS
jgi:hypothetical protein